MSNVVLLYATAPDVETARAIASTLISERLAACVNILGAIESVYRWEGKIETAPECAFLVKTTAETAPAARQAILERHPYAVPAILGFEADAAFSSSAFFGWVRSETGKAT
jgi:periplasmic divalent cation tolerance protein